MRIKDIVKKRIVNFSSYAFKNLFVSPKKREELKKLINKEKKIVIFRKVVDHNILKNITKNRNVILKKKPHFFKTFLGSKDLYIYNKLFLICLKIFFQEYILLLKFLLRSKINLFQ